MPNVRCQARTWLWIERAEATPVDADVVVILEVPSPACALGRLHVSRIAGCHPLERARQQRDRVGLQLGGELGDVDIVVLDRHRALHEHVARVELGIHVVPGAAPDGIAVAEGPGERDRAAMTGQRARDDS